MPGAHGIFVLAMLEGEAGAAIREIQQRVDPKLARESPPHVTLAGSSGVGPIVPNTPPERVRALLEPIAASTPVLRLPFQPAHRFMQTNIVVLPLDPHGALRRLHERIAASGLTFARAKFTFTPHATLSFYRTLDAATLRELLTVRIAAPAVIDRLTVSYTRDPQRPVTLFEVEIGRGAGEGASGEGASGWGGSGDRGADGAAPGTTGRMGRRLEPRGGWGGGGYRGADGAARVRRAPPHHPRPRSPPRRTRPRPTRSRRSPAVSAAPHPSAASPDRRIRGRPPGHAPPARAPPLAPFVHLPHSPNPSTTPALSSAPLPPPTRSGALAPPVASSFSGTYW